MILCDYGCGQEAKYFFKNGKKCCSKNHGSCPNRKLSIYDRNKCKGFRQISCKYCNKKISNEQRKKHETSCPLNPVNIKYCLNCNKIITNREATKFCSKSCSALYTTPGRKHSEETIDKIRKGNKGFLGKRTLTIVKQECPMCGIIVEYKTYSPKLKPRKTCSEECYRKLLSKVSIESNCGGYRENTTRGKSGRYKGIFCASSYELIFVAYHLYIGSDIKPCKLKIPYFYNNKKHHYHPDFLIDGKIYEIKGFHTEVVDLKTNAVKNHGFDIDVLYYEDLEPMLEVLKQNFDFKNVLELYSDT